MTVRNMIQQLIMYPMDSQVVDINESPILFMKYYSRENENVMLVSKDCVDSDEWLTELLDRAEECGETDRETYEELVEQGWTAEDLLYFSDSTYKWFLNMQREYEK